VEKKNNSKTCTDSMEISGDLTKRCLHVISSVRRIFGENKKEENVERKDREKARGENSRAKVGREEKKSVSTRSKSASPELESHLEEGRKGSNWGLVPQDRSKRGVAH